MISTNGHVTAYYGSSAQSFAATIFEHLLVNRFTDLTVLNQASIRLHSLSRSLAPNLNRVDVSWKHMRT